MALTAAAPRYQQGDDPDPPPQPVKLIFIHHSTGENWLTDGYGDLGKTLAENNYFVSDTNYGWGPDSIGDRTDIPDWLEWFASDQTPRYMEALFNESGQNSGYTRLFDDPGGENTIVMFKSCFPNSALEGNPDDPPDPEGWLTVGHAKYVYNEILTYFGTRPDKLFIVITAPPLSDPAYAENARAFNNWLVNDWLAENDYSLPNVAVFDFYNVLTDRNAHHWYRDGQIEHLTASSDTLAYPSGDDHPSETGSRKATEEFVPLLNVFYNRWAANAPVSPATEPEPGQETDLPNSVPLPPETVQVIDDFESGSSAWLASWDAATETNIACTVEAGAGSQGSAALRIDFSVAPGSWANCSLFFEEPQDWSAGEGLAYDLHVEQAGLTFNEILYGGAPENMQMYIHPAETYTAYEGYISYTAFWRDFLRVEWEENPGSPFETPAQVVGLGFGFDAPADNPYTGAIWVDNIRLEKSPSYDEADEPEDAPGDGLPCIGSILAPLALAGLAFSMRRPARKW
jgi:hypothetical protein